MAKTSNQKLKMFYLLQMLREKTDSEHTLTMNQIITGLHYYDVKAERKSVYDDIENLRWLGYDIRCKKGKAYGYYLKEREISLDILKTIANSVASSKYLTQEKVDEIIDSLGSLISVYEAQELKRFILVQGRRGDSGEQVFRNIDAIEKAIAEGRQISFRYFDMQADKTKRYQDKGEKKVVSPYGITWSNEQFYLIGYYEAYENIVHFRIDKIEFIDILEIKMQPKGEYFNLEQHVRRVFLHQGGAQPDWVKLKFHKSLIEPVLDRFGEQCNIESQGDFFVFRANLVVDPNFLGWLFQFGNMVEILSPISLINQLKAKAKELLNRYEK